MTAASLMLLGFELGLGAGPVEELPTVDDSAAMEEPETAPIADPSAPDEADAAPTPPGDADPAPAATPEVEPSPAPTPAKKVTRPPPKPAPSSEAISRQSAAELDTRRRAKWKRPGSPQRFEIEIKFGPYLPEVDRRYGGPGLGPYATIFGRTNDAGEAVGQPRPNVMPVLGFEWQFIYLAGPLGLATQVGFFRDSAKALLTMPEADDDSVRSQADSVTFGVVPIALQLVYRFEYLADRFKIPLVPYGKGGAAYAFWWTRGGGKTSVDANGNKGRGGVWGWQVNAGLMLRLDFIEPGTAKKLDVSTGINHTYVFGEYQFSQLNNFGVGNSIEVGDGTWFAGLAMEF